MVYSAYQTQPNWQEQEREQKQKRQRLMQTIYKRESTSSVLWTVFSVLYLVSAVFMLLISLLSFAYGEDYALILGFLFLFIFVNHIVFGIFCLFQRKKRQNLRNMLSIPDVPLRSIYVGKFVYTLILMFIAGATVNFLAFVAIGYDENTRRYVIRRVKEKDGIETYHVWLG